MMYGGGYEKIVIDSMESQDHEDVIKLVSSLKFDADNCVDFEFLQSTRELLEYWSKMAILARQGDEFVFRFWGSELTDLLGHDLTNKSFLDEAYGNAPEHLAHMIIDVCEQRRTTYSHGNLYYRNGRYIRWHAVSVPVKRRGVCDHVARFYICSI